MHENGLARGGFASFLAGEWVVDLGHAIGSRDWWRGFATLGFLISCGTYALLAYSPQPIPQESAEPLEPAALNSLAFTPLMDGAHTGDSVPMTALAKPLAEAPERPRLDVSLKAQGGSLESLLRRAGASRADIADALAALRSTGAKAQAWQGSTIEVTLGRRETKREPRPLEFVAVRTAFDQRAEIIRTGNDFAASAIALKVADAPVRVSGQIGSSLSVSARRAGVPAAVINKFIQVLSFGVDFQRDVGARDTYDLVFERKVAETGDVQTGGLLYATLTLGKRKETIELTRFSPRGEEPQFFHADGVSVRRMLLKTPVDGARVSSGFGWRTHPILGFSRLHRGIDFAAPTGTPIMAAGDGVIDYIGWKGGYGNFIRLRHSPRYATAYAHLSRFHAQVKSGTRVRQGQIIGYVGSTGFSTGPHLHYEIHVNGAPVNPNDAKLPIGRQLVGADMSNFRDTLARMRALRPLSPAEIAAAPVPGRDG
jgi:murein DD-endopeptidase MepM/ murein hydrolase activator NlpD